MPLFSRKNSEADAHKADFSLEEEVQVEPEFEYATARYSDHEEMEEDLNESAARQGWEPIHYAIWSIGSTQADHFVILRRRIRQKDNSL